MEGGGTKFRASASGNLRQTLKAYRSHVVDRYSFQREVLLRALNEQVLANTPVWEGDVIANWVWSVGAPTGEVVDPIDNGPPGRTGQMALGSEPRRAVNEAQSRTSLNEALSEAKGKLVDIWLSNSSGGAISLEYRRWPTDANSRTPQGGIVRLALLNVLHGFLA